MKKNMKAKALLVAALLTIGGIAETTTIGDALSTKSSVATQAKSSKTGTITSKVNMRKGTSTKYKILVKLPKNAKVNVLKKATNGWYQVKYNGKTGYISGRYIKVANTTTTSSKKVGTVTARTLSMRSGASTRYKVVTKLKKNAKVTVVKKMSNNWYQVKYGGKTGYVSGKYLKVTTAATNTTYSNQLGVTTNNVNMRSGTSTKYKIVAKLRKNADIDVLKKMSNGWYQVKCNKTTGYVSGKYIKLTGKRGISLQEFNKLLPSMGFDKKGDYYDNGTYCGRSAVHNPNDDYDAAGFSFKRITPSYEKALKKCFNLLLPTQGDKLLDMVKNNSFKGEYRAIEMDGRMVHFININNVIDVNILEYRH